ncbi:response regulator [Rhodoferax sp.]|uniref:response regulator n=1 Tax=Rhodoferax sp. TaxID=50421 RepID=UPI0025E1E5E5|nr:response regulator [Rhodoferax sp.]
MALVLVALLPMAGAAAFAMWQVAHVYRDASTHQLQENARTLAQVVDTEMAARTTMLEALATLAANHPPGLLGVDHHLEDYVILAQVGEDAKPSPIASLAAEGIPPDIRAQALAAPERRVSNVFMTGAKQDAPRVALSVPYQESGGARKVLALMVSPLELVRSLQQRSIPSNNLVAVVDGNGRLVARSWDSERFVGTTVPDWARLQVLDAESGVFEALSLEGRSVVIGFQRLAHTPGWVVVVGEPLERFNARWHRPLGTLLAGALLALCLALFLVLWVTRLVLRPVQALAHNAERVATDTQGTADLGPAIAVSPVAEFEGLRQSLEQADTVLRARAEAVRASEARYRELSDALSQEKERLLLATQAGGVGIVELDFAQNRYLWDDQTYAVFGLQRGEFDGSQKQLLARFHPDDIRAMARQWQTALRDTSVLDMELRIVQLAGAVRTVQIHGQVHRHADGRPARAIGTVWDITAAREAADALTAAKEAAEVAERGKSAFLAFMGHEIRTPMNTVLGMTRLVQQTELSGKQRNYLDKIDVSAQLLLGIVNDLLDLSKIEAGKMTLVEAEFTLESLLESVSVAHALKAEEKGLEIAYAVGPDVPARLVGDALRLNQVLGNLVGNAVKFTAQGEVVVSVVLVSDSHASDYLLRFSVRDTGVGLDVAKIARMFLPFSQADNQVSRDYGGSGLGLSICKQLVEHMGGRIGVTSAPGVGRTFSFTVPLHHPNLVAPPLVERNAPILQRRRLLVVDDNASAGSILAQLARGFGMVVQQADSGPAALAQLGAAHDKGRPFDMVLMDWRMPGMDGMQAARQIKAYAAWASIPVMLMVTAYAREALLTEAKSLGLAGVLIKPVTESLVFNTLVDALGNTWTGPPSAESDSPLDLGRLQQRRVLLLAERPLDHEVVVEFLQQIGMQVDTAHDSAQALARLQAAPCDVVLVAHHMPGMDGLAATRALRSEPRWAYLPVLGLVEVADGERAAEPQACLEAGMDDSLTQPLDPEQLARLLVQWLPKDPALASLAGLRVLVVDDNALNREVASEFLQAVRMQVVLAADGQQALEYLEHRDFDMVLMDLQMPVMDGLAASREIRKQARWASLPLIALTAHDSQVGHPAALAAGMDAYLGKPIDESLLYQTLLQFVPQLPCSLPQTAAEAPVLADTCLLYDLPGVDLRLALVRLGGRPASLQRVLGGFVRDFANLPAQWRPPRALPSRNSISAHAHTLKSTARYLGADALADTAVRLEQLAPHATPEQLAEAVALLCLQLDTVLKSAMGLLIDDHSHNAEADADASNATVDVAAVLARIAKARPMVAQGNYAAAELLLGIRSALARTALARMADSALTQFEDLNLSAASATLQVLAEALADNPGDA